MIPDFTDTEISTIRHMLSRHYQIDVEIQLSNSEIQLDPDTDAVFVCPTVFWYARETNFVITKTDQTRFRAEFFYTPHEQFGTDATDYAALDQCISALLQAQSDHERQSGNAAEQQH